MPRGQTGLLKLGNNPRGRARRIFEDFARITTACFAETCGMSASRVALPAVASHVFNLQITRFLSPHIPISKGEDLLARFGGCNNSSFEPGVGQFKGLFNNEHTVRCTGYIISRLEGVLKGGGVKLVVPS